MTTTASTLPWTMFGVRVSAARRLTPTLVRVTFRSHPVRTADNSELNGHDGSAIDSTDELEYFADNGFDQRFKLILPPAGDQGQGLAAMPTGADWFHRWRVMDPDTRPVVRTYTVRAVRPATDMSPAELDVDMVLHGVAGPASAWVSAVVETFERPGGAGVFEAILLGPDSRFDGWHGGLEFVTDVTTDLLLVGDETALPAIASIVERLPSGATGTVLIEVPRPADVQELAAPPGVTISWLPRNGASNGARMAAAALEWMPAVPASAGRAIAADQVTDADNWDELAWEVPAGNDLDGHPAGVRAWVAGEAGAVREIRRHLVGPCGLPRRAVAFMGYWRLGRAEN